MRRSIALVALVALLAGCHTMAWFGEDSRHSRSSSAVDVALIPHDQIAQSSANPQKDLEVSPQGIASEGAAKVVHAGSPGPGSGSGSTDGPVLGILLLMMTMALWRARRGAASKC